MIELLLQAERAMSVGLIDRAEALYEQVAEADPKNSIAVVGLARVRLERGDEAGALALARRALAIDPENAAAARMVERLDEVIAYRGGAAIAPESPSEPATDIPPTPTPAIEPQPAEAEPAAAAEPATAPAPPPIEPPTPEPAPAPAPAPASTPVPAAPPAPRRRSWLDRLFRRR